MPDVQTCAVCGAEKPADVVEQTTVAPIAPIEADICRACQHVQDHSLPRDACMKCGDALSPGFRIDIEYPLGSADLPGRLTGSLCGDCASWIACEIKYEAIDADEDAHSEYMELLDEEYELRSELEGAA